MNHTFYYAASIVILMCSIFGMVANMMAFRRFAASPVRPLLGWTIIAQFFLCLMLGVDEVRDITFRLVGDGAVDPQWIFETFPWPLTVVLTKVALGASVVFSATMMLGLIFRRSTIDIQRAALCSVTWTFILWAAIAFALRTFITSIK